MILTRSLLSYFVIQDSESSKTSSNSPVMKKRNCFSERDTKIDYDESRIKSLNIMHQLKFTTQWLPFSACKNLGSKRICEPTILQTKNLKQKMFLRNTRNMCNECIMSSTITSQSRMSKKRLQGKISSRLQGIINKIVIMLKLLSKQKQTKILIILMYK